MNGDLGNKDIVLDQLIAKWGKAQLIDQALKFSNNSDYVIDLIASREYDEKTETTIDSIDNVYKIKKTADLIGVSTDDLENLSDDQIVEASELAIKRDAKAGGNSEENNKNNAVFPDEKESSIYTSRTVEDNREILTSFREAKTGNLINPILKALKSLPELSRTNPFFAKPYFEDGKFTGKNQIGGSSAVGMAMGAGNFVFDQIFGDLIKEDPNYNLDKSLDAIDEFSKTPSEDTPIDLERD